MGAGRPLSARQGDPQPANHHNQQGREEVDVQNHDNPTPAECTGSGVLAIQHGSRVVGRRVTGIGPDRGMVDVTIERPFGRKPVLLRVAVDVAPQLVAALSGRPQVPAELGTPMPAERAPAAPELPDMLWQVLGAGLSGRYGLVDNAVYTSREDAVAAACAHARTVASEVEDDDGDVLITSHDGRKFTLQMLEVTRPAALPTPAQWSPVGERRFSRVVDGKAWILEHFDAGEIAPDDPGEGWYLVGPGYPRGDWMGTDDWAEAEKRANEQLAAWHRHHPAPSHGLPVVALDAVTAALGVDAPTAVCTVADVDETADDIDPCDPAGDDDGGRWTDPVELAGFAADAAGEGLADDFGDCE